MTTREKAISTAQLTGVILFLSALSAPILYVSAVKTDVAVITEKVERDRSDISELKDDIKVIRSLVENVAARQGVDVKKVSELSWKN